MERHKLKAIIENLLLVSEHPVTVDSFHKTLSLECGREEIKSGLEELKNDYSGRSVQIQEVAEGFQLCSRPEYSEWIKKFHNLDKSSKLSPAALDTLSIIAYKQPITRAEIEDIRGVDSGGVVKTLFEKKLLRITGRKQVMGRPILYGTSNKFLEYFGLRHIDELPTLKEFSDKDEEEGPHQASLPFGDQPEPAPDEDKGLDEEPEELEPPGEDIEAEAEEAAEDMVAETENEDEPYESVEPPEPIGPFGLDENGDLKEVISAIDAMDEVEEEDEVFPGPPKPPAEE